ncbi:MAG: UbiA family prenyltransferase [Desulfomonile tiedjei]|nr:UbiA family prenyltransferase [Desulfomonile tiedjei]
MLIPAGFVETTRRLLALVKIEHTLFGFPLALTGAILAARGLPEVKVLALIIVAFASARAAAMAFNRVVDRHSDAANPRTAAREIPSGLVRPAQAWGLVVVACAVFFLAAWGLNEVCLFFSPLVLAILIGYSYTKRFTWLCHIFLGLCLGLAPIAGWLAVTPQWSWIPVVFALGVVFWVAGFDMIYACQDVDFDRTSGLHSLPAKLGTRAALRLAGAAHLLAFAFFLSAGALANLNWSFYILSLITAGLLLWEHRIVRPDDLTRLDLAFFKVNSMVSLSLIAAVSSGLV